MQLNRTDEVVAKGKTKIGRRATSPEVPDDLVVFEATADITAGNDPALTKQMEAKPVAATKTTSQVFRLLKAYGVPAAFIEQVSPTEFVAPLVTMIPLECVARRYAVGGGSFVSRYPSFKPVDPKRPHRFGQLRLETFLKTKNGVLETIHGEKIDLGFARLPAVPGSEGLPLLVDKKCDDPLVVNLQDRVWTIRKPHKAHDDPDGFIARTIDASQVLPNGIHIGPINELVHRTFDILERAWAALGFRLMDFKLEFGVLPDGSLVLADVVDNDSWRLWDAEGNELSKEKFRQGDAMDEVQEAYQRVAALVEQFQIPG